MKYSWTSPITLSENSVEKMQVFWPWSSFKISAWTVPRTVESVRALISAISAAVASPVLFSLNLSICWSMAQLRNIARIVGAGPLIVMLTLVAGSHRSNPE